MQLSTGKVDIATLPGFCRFCRMVIPGAYLIGIGFGIDAGVLLSLGVAAEDLIRGNEPEAQHTVSDDFVDPTVIKEDAA